MKVKLLLFAMLFLGVHSLSYADFNYGIRAGVSTVSDVKVQDLTQGTDYILDYAKGDPGFHFGGLAKLQILKFFVQPEVLFSVTRTDLQFHVPGRLTPVIGKQSFRKLDVPVMAGMKFGPFKVQAGPVATMKINTKMDFEDDYTMQQDYKGATFGYQAGIGLELSSLVLDVKYEGSLSRFGTGATFGDHEVEFDQRISQWVLSLGFFLND